MTFFQLLHVGRNLIFYHCKLSIHNDTKTKRHITTSLLYYKHDTKGTKTLETYLKINPESANYVEMLDKQIAKILVE